LLDTCKMRPETAENTNRKPGRSWMSRTQTHTHPD